MNTDRNQHLRVGFMTFMLPTSRGRSMHYGFTSGKLLNCPSLQNSLHRTFSLCAGEITVRTQQSSLSMSSFRWSPAWIFSPVQALKLTAFEEGCKEGPDAHTGVFRQWIVMYCTASVLKRWMRFIWIRPTLISIYREIIKQIFFFDWLIQLSRVWMFLNVEQCFS